MKCYSCHVQTSVLNFHRFADGSAGREHFLVARVLLPPARGGTWFEFTSYASLEGRYVGDTRPAVRIDTHEQRFAILDLLGIQYFSLSYEAAPGWFLQLCFLD